MWKWVGLFGVVALVSGCARMASPSAAPSSAQAAPADAALTTKPATASSAGELEARIDGDIISVAGARAEGDQLKVALSQARGAATLLVVEAAAGYSDRALGQLLAAAPGAGLRQVRLSVAGQVLTFSTSTGGGKKQIVAWVRDDQVVAYDLQASDSTKGMLGSFQLGEPAAEAALHDALAAACQGQPCATELDLVAGGKTSLWRTLGAWQRAAGSIPNLLWEVLVIDANRLSPPDPNANVKHGASAVSGRLPPTVIQHVVRKNFEKFRKCYEEGLARNDKLEGRVNARFVIGRDGKVSNVADGGSDLPDAEVVSCVLRAFYTLEFPPPENGIVTVVYPIMLAPG